MNCISANILLLFGALAGYFILFWTGMQVGERKALRQYEEMRGGARANMAKDVPPPPPENTTLEQPFAPYSGP